MARQAAGYLQSGYIRFTQARDWARKNKGLILVALMILLVRTESASALSDEEQRESPRSTSCRLPHFRTTRKNYPVVAFVTIADTGFCRLSLHSGNAESDLKKTLNCCAMSPSATQAFVVQWYVMRKSARRELEALLAAKDGMGLGAGGPAGAAGGAPGLGGAGFAAGGEEEEDPFAAAGGADAAAGGAWGPR